MNEQMRMLRAFHEKFGHVIGDNPGFRGSDLRANLIEEEARETVTAIRNGDMVEAIDGMCDLLYVVLGTAVSFGIDIEKYFAEVHRTNMLKSGGMTRADGKTLKPPGWRAPRISDMLAADNRYPPELPW